MYLNCGYTYIDGGGGEGTQHNYVTACDECNDIYMMNLSEFCYFRCTGTYTLIVVSDGSQGKRNGIG